MFAATLFHAMINVSYSAFPDNGSSYDPVFLAPVLALAAVAVTAASSAWARRPRRQR